MTASIGDSQATPPSQAQPGGLGWRLGLQLRQWLESEPQQLRSSQAIANRLIDALGAEDSLRGPLRDLASRPLLLEALHGRGANRQAAAAGLAQQLAPIYAPAVLRELLDLLEAASGAAFSGELAIPSAESPPTQTAALGRAGPSWLAIAPGAALAASGALVISWLARELDRSLFEAWGWNGGVVLVLALALAQALAIGPLRRLRRHWPLSDRQAVEPRDVWRWLSCSWIHTNGAEAAVNLVMLLILLGGSPLPLGAVVLRYLLTCLACLLPAVLLARLHGVARLWSGSAGAISALVSLAAGLSLLQWRVLRFATPLLSIPAWVLLLAYGALQLSWQLQRRPHDSHSRPRDRLLSAPWSWGLVFGLGWAVITRVRELL